MNIATEVNLEVLGQIAAESISKINPNEPNGKRWINAIAKATATELTENSATYFHQLGTDGAGVTLIDGPNIDVVGPSIRQKLDLPLRMILALLVGLGLIFLLDYLDTSVRNRRELEEMGFAVIGEISKYNRKHK